jgi:hypothetical protein
VVNYEVRSAYLHVEHRFVPDATPSLSNAVEITQVLETIKSTDLQAGSWLNVIGYVRSSPASKNKRKRAEEPAPILLPQVVVQAILIWNAGAVSISEYERTLSHQQEARKLATEAVAEHVQP